MKIKIVQDAVIFISALTVEQFEKAKRFTPEALTLYHTGDDKKKTPVCSIDYRNAGGVNENGIIFDSTTDNGNLCFTGLKAEGVDPHITTEEKIKCISETFSSLILKVNELEEQVLSSLTAKETEIETAMNSISAVTLED